MWKAFRFVFGGVLGYFFAIAFIFGVAFLAGFLSAPHQQQPNHITKATRS
jgi:hypothetical protein